MKSGIIFPFRLMGYRPCRKHLRPSYRTRNAYFYEADGTKYAIYRHDHGAGVLLMFAPVEFWAREFPPRQPDGEAFNVKAAAQALLLAQHNKGQAQDADALRWLGNYDRSGIIHPKKENQK